MTIFTLQELVISGVYMYKAFQLLNGQVLCRGPTAAMLVRHLLMVHVAIVVLEISLLSIIYTGHYEVETAYKPAVYSIKLKMEFAVLNDLVDLFTDPNRLRPTSGPSTHQSTPGSYSTPRSGRREQLSGTVNRNNGSAPFAASREARGIEIVRSNEARTLRRRSHPLENNASDVI